MNWYYEEQGISRGPVSEIELREKIDSQALGADALIWNPSLKEWGRIRELMPAWLSEPAPKRAVESVAPKTEVAEKPPAQESPRPAKTAAKSEAVSAPPVVEEDWVSSPDRPLPAAAPVPSKLKPKAPVAAEAEPAQKSGLFKSLFGMGGKKK